MHLRAARSRRAAIIKIEDHDCSECWLVDLEQPEQRRRASSCRARPGLRYDVEPGRDRLFMRTNSDGAFDYKILSIPLDAIDGGDWREEVAHRPGRMIFNATVFADWLVWLERETCKPRLLAKSRDGAEQELAFRRRPAITCACRTISISNGRSCAFPIPR